jgi:hypothetical protein
MWYMPSGFRIGNPVGKCIRAYSSATHATGTATASGTFSASNLRISQSASTHVTGITTMKPNHEYIIMECATVTHLVASAKNTAPPRYAAR